MFIDAAKKEAEQKAILNQKRKNPWQAPPLTHQETVFSKQEKIMDEIPAHQIRISFTTTPSMAKMNASYMKLKIQINE